MKTRGLNIEYRSIYSDTFWVLKVINSADSLSHKGALEKLIVNFNRKHLPADPSLEDLEMLTTFNNVLRESLRETLKRIRKSKVV